MAPAVLDLHKGSSSIVATWLIAPSIQLHLHTSTLFPWKLGGSLACSIVMLTHRQFW